MSSKPFNSAPLYVQLRTDLTRRIAKGDWKRGDSMPNEIDIAREYGLSPGTVRKALDWMEEAHLIVRQQGRGTFVAGISAADLDLRFNRIRLPAEPAAVAIEHRVISSTFGEATQDEAHHLRLQERDPVFRLERLCRARSTPLMLEQITVARRMFPSLEASNAPYDLAELSQASGVLLGVGHESLTLVAADAVVAAHLEIAPGTRVMALERTINTIEEQPAEWRRAWCNLEGYRYHVELN